jgi:hypothetical protein
MSTRTAIVPPAADFKTARIAGATVLDDIGLSVLQAATRFATNHPAYGNEIANKMPAILATLAAAAHSHYEAAAADA